MKITGQYVFNHDLLTVWTILMNPAAIAKAIPGVQQIEPVEGEVQAYRVVSKLKAAALGGLYGGTVRLTEIQPPERFRLTVSGSGEGEKALSQISGTALITLNSTSNDPSITQVSWQAEVTMGGEVGEFTRGLIEMGAAVLGKQYFTSMARQLDEVQPDPDAEGNADA